MITVAVLLVLMAQQATAAPSASTTSGSGTLPKMESGEMYPAPPSGARYYLDLKRPPSTEATVDEGFVSSYYIGGEDKLIVPTASVLFQSASATGYHGVLLLAQPPSINGKVYDCPQSAQGASEFVRRFHTCASLPNGLFDHPVRISLYQVKFPDGSTRYVTDSITTLP